MLITTLYRTKYLDRAFLCLHNSRKEHTQLMHFDVNTSDDDVNDDVSGDETFLGVNKTYLNTFSFILRIHIFLVHMVNAQTVGR